MQAPCRPTARHGRAIAACSAARSRSADRRPLVPPGQPAVLVRRKPAAVRRSNAERAACFRRRTSACSRRRIARSGRSPIRSWTRCGIADGARRRRPRRRRRLVHDPARPSRRTERPGLRRRTSSAQMIEAISRRVQREGLQQRPHGARHGDRSAAAAGPRRRADRRRVPRDGRPGRPEMIRTLLEQRRARRSSRRGASASSTFCRATAGPVPAPDERVDPETVIRAAQSRGPEAAGARDRAAVPVLLLVFGKDPKRATP